MTKKLHVQGTNFRWVVPQLPPEVWDTKQTFKTDLLDRLKSSKTARKGIRYYSIAIESHADGNPHLDLLLIFEKSIRLTNIELDFLCSKHGDLTRYRTLNQAILQYGSKQDSPLSNLQNVEFILNEQDIKRCPVTFLMRQVDKDPFGFDFLEYCLDNNHFTTIQRWSYVKNKIKDYQETTCNKLLKSKPGIRFISDELINTTLSDSQLKTYRSHPFYSTIVRYLNDISTYGWERPFTSRQLYVSGRSRIGKSYLIRTLSQYTSTYPVGTQNWFPKFQNFTYKLMIWDQCDLKMMSKQQMLQLFDGDPFNLPYKGGSILKRDNQLWLMCSNKTLQQQFVHAGYDTSRDPLSGQYLDQQVTALRNRIQQIVVPQGYDLEIVRKLVLL
jgi:hypothetical protein